MNDGTIKINARTSSIAANFISWLLYTQRVPYADLHGQGTCADSETDDET